MLTFGGADVLQLRAVRVALAAAAVTAVVYGIPFIFFAYPFPGATLFLAALTSTSAVVVSVLFWLRHARGRQRTDLDVAILFCLIAVLEGLLPLVAELVPESENLAFWSRVIARSIVALGLCVVAWRDGEVVRGVRFSRVVAIAFGIATVVVLATFVWGSSLPTVVIGDHGDPAIVRTPSVLAIRLCGSLLLLAAAAGFVRRARTWDDPVFDWLASGAVLMATARLHDFLYPSMHGDWVTTADILRLVAQWVVLAGLLYECSDLWRRHSADAVAAERSRLAAEIHDGLAQDLAYISSQSSAVARDSSDDVRVARLRQAADRALGEARRVISQCQTTGDDRDLGDVIADLGRDIEVRFDVPVVLDIDGDIVVDGHTAHEVERIVGEAFANAVRHARPNRISARLEAEPHQVRLMVADDGWGMPAYMRQGRMTMVIPTGFGLMSMQERVRRLGGSYSLVSTPGLGTTVKIAVPR